MYYNLKALRSFAVERQGAKEEDVHGWHKSAALMREYGKNLTEIRREYGVFISPMACLRGCESGPSEE